MSYATEFPDFPAADLPPIPEGWEDISWHNDTCPSFDVGSGQRVYVDYADEARREIAGLERFHLVDEGGQVLLASDDWQQILAAVGA